MPCFHKLKSRAFGKGERSRLTITMGQQANGSRIFALEAAKFLAAFVVAMIHLAPCTPNAELLTNVIRLFPVYYFYASAVHFTVRRVLWKDDRMANAVSFGRLVRPYAAWTVLYLLLRWQKNGGLPSSEGWHDWFGFLFMGQSAVHLYFLPQLIYFQIVAASSALVCWNLFHKRIHRTAVCWFGLAFVASVCIDRAGYFGWNHAFLSGLIYASLGGASVALDSRVRRVWDRVVVSAGCLMFLFVIIAALGTEMPWFYHVLSGPVFGSCTLLVLLRMRLGVPPRWLEWLVSSYFGIYLAHHAIEEGIELLFRKFGLELIPYDVASRLFFALLAVSGGIVITWMIRLVPPLAWWLLGEDSGLARGTFGSVEKCKAR